MRARLLASSLTFALLITVGAPAALVACGDKKPADAPKNDDSNALDASSSSTSSTSSDDAGATTTTTTTLGDSGDLQGARLSTSSTHVVEAKASDGGAHKGDGGKGGHDPGRSPDDIFTIVGQRREEARACYDAELKKNPKISEGTLWIDWTIDPDGNVTSPKLNEQQSEIKEAPVVTCVIEIIKKIKFAKSPRGMESHTNYKFGFKRNSRPARP